MYFTGMKDEYRNFDFILTPKIDFKIFVGKSGFSLNIQKVFFNKVSEFRFSDQI
jgi:hypothetical protein